MLISSKVSPSTLFFFCKNILAILGPLYFHINDCINIWILCGSIYIVCFCLGFLPKLFNGLSLPTGSSPSFLP